MLWLKDQREHIKICRNIVFPEKILSGIDRIGTFKPIDEKSRIRSDHHPAYLKTEFLDLHPE